MSRICGPRLARIETLRKVLVKIARAKAKIRRPGRSSPRQEPR
jgi:hypothetical protein